MKPDVLFQKMKFIFILMYDHVCTYLTHGIIIHDIKAVNYIFDRIEIFVITMIMLKTRNMIFRNAKQRTYILQLLKIRRTSYLFQPQFEIVVAREKLLINTLIGVIITKSFKQVNYFIYHFLS